MPTWIPIFICLVAVFLSVTPIVTDPDPMYLFALGFALLGVPVYYCCCYKKTLQPKACLSKTWFLPQSSIENPHLFQIVSLTTCKSYSRLCPPTPQNFSLRFFIIKYNYWLEKHAQSWTNITGASSS